MKKNSLLTAVTAFAVSLGFMACSPEIPSVLDPLGVTSKGSSGGGGSGSGASGSTIVVPANMTTRTVTTSEDIGGDVTLDLAADKLTAATVSAHAVGSEVTDWFSEDKILASGSAVNASISPKAILFDTAPSSTTNAFKAVVKEISEVKLVVTITTSNPGQNCSIMRKAIIPAECTESGKAHVEFIEKIDVGTGAGTPSTASVSIKDGTIPSADVVKGKIFQVDDDSDSRIKYYKFDESGSNITEYRYKKCNAQRKNAIFATITV